MNEAADNIRVLIAEMVEKAKSGHPGGAMGAADFINVLYSGFLVYDPEDPNWFARDRFFLDPGHMSPMLYSVLALCGRYTIDDLKAFRQWGSVHLKCREMYEYIFASLVRDESEAFFRIKPFYCTFHCSAS